MSSYNTVPVREQKEKEKKKKKERGKQVLDAVASGSRTKPAAT